MQLPEPVWRAALERLDRLPLAKVTREWQWHALSANEARFVNRFGTKCGLDDRQNFALYQRYMAAVEDRAHDVIPQFVPERISTRGPTQTGLFAVRRRGPLRRRLISATMFLRGWACWFRNRRAGIRDAWFRLTWRYYCSRFALLGAARHNMTHTDVPRKDRAPCPANSSSLRGPTR